MAESWPSLTTSQTDARSLPGVKQTSLCLSVSKEKTIRDEEESQHIEPLKLQAHVPYTSGFEEAILLFKIWPFYDIEFKTKLKLNLFIFKV